MASVLKTDFIPFGHVCSIITSYVGPDTFPSSKFKSEVNRVWIQIWQEAEPHRYIDWALCDRIIDFPGPKVIRIRQFLEHIYALLLEISANAQERKIFSSIATLLKLQRYFLSINPLIFPQCDPNASSHVGFAHQGVMINKTKDLKKVDSLLIKVRIDRSNVQIMVDKNNLWHLGITPKYSSLLHELIHVKFMLEQKSMDRASKVLQELSFRWTNRDEMETINLENAFLNNRGKMMRLSHKVTKYDHRYFKDLSLLDQLVFALQMGANGTVDELCKRHLKSSVGSPDHINFKVQKLFESLATAFLIEYPKSHQIIHKQIDSDLKANVLLRKKLALIDILNTFKDSGHIGLAINFLFHLRKTCVEQQHTHLIPFIKTTQKTYKP